MQELNKFTAINMLRQAAANLPIDFDDEQRASPYLCDQLADISYDFVNGAHTALILKGMITEKICNKFSVYTYLGISEHDGSNYHKAYKYRQKLVRELIAEIEKDWK